MSYLRRFCDAYEVDFLLKEATKSAASAASVVKNRRYKAMKELIEKGEYFSMTEMKNRNPFLFNHLVGKHMSQDEREALEPSRNEVTNLSTILMNHMDRAPGLNQKSSRRKEQEAEEMVWNEKQHEDYEAEENEDNSDVEEIEEQEAEMFREEFISSMHQRFLEGKDKDFDYTLVDNNPQYDNVECQERDAEDRYFDSD